MHSFEPSCSYTDFNGAETHILKRLDEELPETLQYHGSQHTRDVMEAAAVIAASEHLTEEEKNLLRIAAAFHDAGFIYVYIGHEEKGCEMAKEILPSFGFSPLQIDRICGMIM